MWILLKFHYAKFGVSNLCFSKVFEEKPLGVGFLPPPPPLGAGRSNNMKRCIYLATPKNTAAVSSTQKIQIFEIQTPQKILC